MCVKQLLFCWLSATSFYSLLYNWRALGGLWGVTDGGLTDLQPLKGGSGVLHPK